MMNKLFHILQEQTRDAPAKKVNVNQHVNAKTVRNHAQSGVPAKTAA